MKYLGIQEFVRRVRKRARRLGCQKCGGYKQVGLRGSPRLSELARDGSGIRRIKSAIRLRGWFCLKCVNKMDGTTTAATLRDQFPPGPEGNTEYTRHHWKVLKNCPPGWEYDPKTDGGEPGLRNVVTKKPF
jgi:hypothetical protein